MSDRSAAAHRHASPPGIAPDEDFVPLARSAGYHVRQLAETWQAVMDREAETKGITVTQWRYLRELWEEDGLSSGELTRRVGRQGPTTVVAVRNLERDGLVKLTKSPDDRRKSYVQLTARGRRLAAAVAPLIRQVNDMALSALAPDERQAFLRTIVRLQRHLDAAGRSRNAWSEWRTEQLAKEVGL